MKADSNLRNAYILRKKGYKVKQVHNLTFFKDYEFEKTIRHINFDVCSTIDTIFLIPPREFAEVSSSLVKGFVGSQGWEQIVARYVPEIVLQALIKKYYKENHAKCK